MDKRKIDVFACPMLCEARIVSMVFVCGSREPVLANKHDFCSSSGTCGAGVYAYADVQVEYACASMVCVWGWLSTRVCVCHTCPTTEAIS